MFLGIDHVQLLGPEGCEQEARNFYENLLGMKTVLKPENLRHRGGMWFQCGTQEVHISIQDDYIPAKKAHPAFVVEDIKTLRRKLADEGCVLSEEEPIAGRERFFVHDPFGNRLEFLQYDK
ncbi:VOC family protein [Priestia megaterium]|uniref:VOC family protein n=1 Tax=Priestia megaterium TaxID=1404 RepID=UPI002E2425BB|nr:VOC family protein [Priestia megaterium]